MKVFCVCSAEITEMYSCYNSAAEPEQSHEQRLPLVATWSNCQYKMITNSKIILSNLNIKVSRTTDISTATCCRKQKHCALWEFSACSPLSLIIMTFNI